MVSEKIKNMVDNKDEKLVAILKDMSNNDRIEALIYIKDKYHTSSLVYGFLEELDKHCLFTKDEWYKFGVIFSSIF